MRDVILVVARGKESIVDHFDIAAELEAHLERTGKHELKKQMRSIAQMANVITVRQQEPLGLGHAVLCARDVIGDEPFVVMLGGRHHRRARSRREAARGYGEARPRHGGAHGGPAGGDLDVRHRRGDELEPRTIKVERIVEKPKKRSTLQPRSSAGTCRLHASSRCSIRSAGSEAIQPPTRSRCSRARRAVRLPLRRGSVRRGRPAGVSEGELAFALKRPDPAGRPLRELMKEMSC